MTRDELLQAIQFAEEARREAPIGSFTAFAVALAQVLDAEYNTCAYPDGWRY